MIGDDACSTFVELLKRILDIVSDIEKEKRRGEGYQKKDTPKIKVGKLSKSNFAKLQKAGADFKFVTVPANKLAEIEETVKKMGGSYFNAEVGDNNNAVLAVPASQLDLLNMAMKHVVANELAENSENIIVKDGKDLIDSEDIGIISRVMNKYDIPVITFKTEDNKYMNVVPKEYEGQYSKALSEAEQIKNEVDNIEVTRYEQTAPLDALGFEAYLVTQDEAKELSAAANSEKLDISFVPYGDKVDLMFDKRKEAAPKALSVQYYEEFKQAAGKTMQSILISTTTKLQYFKLENVRNLTFMDNISLETMGDKKVALFIVIPSTDTTYNFLAAMMYTQLFDTLYDRAINHFHGRLPVHVRFILDEFANVGKIPDFEKVLATCRKFEISAQVILQNLSQLKRMYEKSWEELPGNCDTLIYLGGKDQFTNEYLSKELGKETIDQLSINQTKGKQGSSSYNNAIMGRELATIDELTTMDNNNCIVMVRGLYPFFTNKFNLSEHPRYAELGEGWKPDAEKGETASDNPYVYYLDRYVDTQPETEFIDFSEFIDTGDTESADTIRLRFVTADDNGAEIEQTESIMSDIPAEIQKLLEHCTGLYNVA